MQRTYENARNPVLPLDIFVPDGEAHVMPDGKLYIYGSYDLPGNLYCSDEYHVVSTPDMVHWCVHNVSLQTKDFTWEKDINIDIYPDFLQEPETPLLKKILAEERSNADAAPQTQTLSAPQKLLFAPDAAYHNGHYLLYFCMDDASEGVARSDSPIGPFTNPIKLPCRGIDPAIFIDQDGTGYYYWGQFYAHAVALERDMVSFCQENVKNWVLTEQEHFFHEGSSMRKIGDTYYAVYANMERGRPTSLGYATSKSPLGPFTYRGILVDNAKCDPASWNNHGSIECFQGKWYLFYHRCSRNKHNFRRLCIEPLTILADGSIPEVCMTSQGAGAPFAPEEAIMGYHACEVEGAVYLDTHPTYGEALCNIAHGDTACYRYIKSTRDYQEIIFECEGSGTIEVLLNNQTFGHYTICEGVQTQHALQAPNGQYEVRLQFHQPNNLVLLRFWVR